MPRTIKIFSIYFLVFMYVYGIKYIFLPVSTRVILGGLGAVLLTHQLLKDRIAIKKPIIIVIMFLVLIATVSFLSILINNSNDTEFVVYSLSMFINIIASYFVIKVYSFLGGSLEQKDIARVLINTILIQSLISLAMFIFPELKLFLLRLEQMPQETFNYTLYLSEIRFIGIGSAKTFTAGIINGFALILIGLTIKLYPTSLKETIYLTIKFLIIFTLGMMMARTTLVGALIALIIIFIPNNIHFHIKKNKVNDIFLFFSTLIFITSISFTAMYIFSPLFLTKLQYGFEMFVNYFVNNKFETASTNELKTMYIFPDNLQSWVIGDGHWMNYSTNPITYYQSTDVGFSRLIFYFGIIGTFIYFMMQSYIIKVSYKVKFNYLLLILCYIFILNLKGFTDLLWLNMLFFMANILNPTLQSRTLNNSLPLKR